MLHCYNYHLCFFYFLLISCPQLCYVQLVQKAKFIVAALHSSFVPPPDALAFVQTVLIVVRM